MSSQMEKFKQIKNFVPKVLQEETPRQKTIKSLRKLQIFGKDWPDKIDFEWPTADDLMAIQDLENLKLSCINWKHSAGISCIQFEFRNGVKSPLIISKNQDADKMVRTEVSPTHRARIIKSQVFHARNKDFVCSVQFIDNKGEAYVKIEPLYSGCFESRLLKEDEEIIGFYGVAERKSWLVSLGFIVWTPPK